MGIKNIEFEANQGNVEALVKLGRIYLEGMGVDPDYKKAHSYFSKAAHEDNAQAFAYLAYMNAYGLGVERSDEKVVKYFEKAFELNDAYSGFALGFVYKKGLYGEDKDPDKAREYFEKAASMGISGAKYEQALILEKDAKRLSESSDAQDRQKAQELKPKALSLFKEAANDNYVPAKYALAVKYLNENNPQKDKEAFNLLDSSKDSGIALVYYALAFCYDYAKGCEQDFFKAFDYYQQAYEAGYKKAIMNIAYAYLTGCGCGQNYRKAIDICRDAVNGGIQEANFFAALCFENGLGVDQDYEKAIQLYGFAQQAGYMPAFMKTGQMYDPYYGIGGDESGAKEEYEKAAELGSIDAKAELAKLSYDEDPKAKLDELTKLAAEGSSTANEIIGTLYKDGRGVAKDEAKALEYYKKAADNGSQKAAKEIIAIATEKQDKALLVKYGDKLFTFKTPKDYFNRAKVLQEDGEAERAAFWYAMAGLSTIKEDNTLRAEQAIKDNFEKGPNGYWSAKK